MVKLHVYININSLVYRKNLLIYVTNPACASTGTSFHISSSLSNTRSSADTLYELLYSTIVVGFSPDEEILYSTLWRMILFCSRERKSYL